MIYNLLYARKRKDRWWRFHTLKDAFIKAQRESATTKSELRPLTVAFGYLGYGRVPEALQLFWRELVALGGERKSFLHGGDLEQIEVLAWKLQPESLQATCWLDLYRLCLGTGFFQLARALREHGLARMAMDATEGDADLGTTARGCFAKIEQGDFDGARTLIKSMSHLGCSVERRVQANWLVELLAGHQAQNRFGFPEAASPRDLAFGQLVKDKTIALVGPVPSKVVQGGAIDSHDVVVKFGYRGGDKGRDPETQGERIDVSYYNNAQAKLLATSGFDEVSSTIAWAVCNNRKGRSLLPADHPRLRELASVQWLLPDTHFNAGPNAIIDLLRFCPAKIMVFNTDLMLSSGRFAGYTAAGAKPIDHTRSFIKTHDPILQYTVVQRLWKSGYVSGDRRFDEVMAMGLRLYLDQLQQAYGANNTALL